MIDFGIHLMDCMDGMKQIPDGTVHLVATDPPYGINYVSCHRYNDYESEVARQVNGDESFDPDRFEMWVKEFYRILADDTHLYVFGSDAVIGDQKKIISKFFTFKNIIVWDKQNHTAGDLEGQYGRCTEFLTYAVKGRRALKKGRRPSMISIARVSPDKQVHSCQKPVSLMGFLIENSTDPGEIVCDPFLGSGTTAIAAVNLGRKFIGFENDSKTFEIAQKRLYGDSIQAKLF